MGQEKATGFLEFLKQHKKSAYGTFVLKDGTDGFILVPFQQEQPSLGDATMIACKYVLGLGLTNSNGDMKGASNTSQDNNFASNQNGDEDDYVQSSVLGSLLSASQRNSASLAAVPKGSVKVQQPIAFSRPKAAGPGSRVKDWFRTRVEVIELSSDSDDDDPAYYEPKKKMP